MIKENAHLRRAVLFQLQTKAPSCIWTICFRCAAHENRFFLVDGRRLVVGRL